MSKRHGFIISHKCVNCGKVQDVHGGVTLPGNLQVESKAVGTTLHFNEEKAPASAEQKIKQDQLSQGLQQPQKEEKRFIKGKLPMK